MLAAPVLFAQSKSAEDLTAGKLLVAPREAPDPDFAETVILLVRYERGGALGLIVNHPSAIPVSKALRDVKGAGKSAEPLYLGGPVDVAAVMALVRSTEAPRDGLRIFGDLFVINSKKDMEGALNASKTSGVSAFTSAIAGGAADNWKTRSSWAAGTFSTAARRLYSTPSRRRCGRG
jgi:putative transcriptional regulator